MYYIVLARKWNNSTNILFLMKDSDHRFGSDNYQMITKVKKTPRRLAADNGCVMKIYVGEDGREYGVFAGDYSARIINHE